MQTLESNENEARTNATPVVVESSAGQRDIINENSIDEDVRTAVRNLSKGSVSIHNSVIRALTGMHACCHGGRRIEDWAYSRCVKPLEKLQRTVS